MKRTSLIAAGMAAYGVLISNAFSNPVWPIGVRSYSSIVSRLDSLAKAQPALAQTFTIGQSNLGEPIYGLKIGSGPVPTLVVGTHHGNEYGSTEVAMGFAENLLSQPILDQTVYVLPVLNINGYESADREEQLSPWGRTQDPNRDYPGPCGSDGPFLLNSTQALAQWIETAGIVSLATLHTFYPAVVYPWGFTTHDFYTPDQSIFELLVRLATQNSGYDVGNSAQVIYPANGTFEDYAYWKSGIWSILFELGTTHYPSDSQVKKMIQQNVPGLRQMLENAPRSRSTGHAFAGKCDHALRALDRRDE